MGDEKVSRCWSQWPCWRRLTDEPGPMWSVAIGCSFFFAVFRGFPARNSYKICCSNAARFTSLFTRKRKKKSSLTIWKIKFDETKRKKAGREISCAVLNWNVHHTIKFDRQNVFCFCFSAPLSCSDRLWTSIHTMLLLVYIVCGVPRVIPRLRKKLSSFSYYFQALFLFTSATQRTPSKPAKWWTHRSLRRITIIAKKEVRKKEHRGEGGKRVLETLLFRFFVHFQGRRRWNFSLSLF